MSPSDLPGPDWRTGQPAFEFIVGGPGGHTYRIWGSGETEGFPPGITINRIPQMLMIAHAPHKSVVAECAPSAEKQPIPTRGD